MTPTADAVGHEVIDGVYDVDFTQFAINPDFAPGVEEFVDAYVERFGESPRSGHSLMNYVGGHAILSELDKASDLSATTIRDAMTGINI
ncbi:hypothetical protein ACT3RL_18155, partial [Halomonas sp. AOP5-CZ2-32]